MRTSILSSYRPHEQGLGCKEPITVMQSIAAATGTESLAQIFFFLPPGRLMEPQPFPKYSSELM